MGVSPIKSQNTMVVKNKRVNNLAPGTYMVKLSVEQLKALQNLKNIQMQQ